MANCLSGHSRSEADVFILQIHHVHQPRFSLQSPSRLEYLELTLIDEPYIANTTGMTARIVTSDSLPTLGDRSKREDGL